MKKLISLSLFSSCILFISNPIKADWDKVAKDYKNRGTLNGPLNVAFDITE